VNGILCDDNPAALERSLRSLIESPDLARSLGREAFTYYSHEATIENMVANFEKAMVYGEALRA